VAKTINIYDKFFYDVACQKLSKSANALRRYLKIKAARII